MIATDSIDYEILIRLGLLETAYIHDIDVFKHYMSYLLFTSSLYSDEAFMFIHGDIEL